jgi:hypothetical protein
LCILDVEGQVVFDRNLPSDGGAQPRRPTRRAANDLREVSPPL